MFCENCGAKNDSDAEFCENCGNMLEATPVSPQQLRQPPVRQQAYPQAAPAYNEHLATAKKTRPVGKIVGFSALGAVLLFGIIIAAVQLKDIADSKPSTTTAEAIAEGSLPEDISSVDLTGRWYMLMSYYTEFEKGNPPYILYKLQLDLKRDLFGKHVGKVTTLDAYYNKEHADYPGGGVPPELSGEAVITAAGKNMWFILRDKENPYPHAIDCWEVEIREGRYIQSILFPQYDHQGDGELYPFGYLRSEDSEDYIWH